MIIGDFRAAATLQFLGSLIVVAYLIFVLGINFGDQWGFVILASFAGSVMGVSYGVFLTSILKLSNNAAQGLLIASTMMFCALAGLMYGNMKHVIERSAPVINRINPAALISDSFYSLSAYGNYSRYTQSVISMLIISCIFCAASALVLRRKQYADI
jgi:ABC-2 type transport system permease protein